MSDTLPLLLVFVMAQRLVELIIAQANARHLRRKGAVEYGAGHYKYFVLLHTSFLASLYIESRDRGYFYHWVPSTLAVSLMIAFLLAQIFRIWCISSLGRFWNTRILVLPGAKVVQRGPYKILKHPNYLVVCCELIVLSVLFHAYLTGLVFSLINLLLIVHRTTVEEYALRQQTDYAQTMDKTLRLFPHRKIR